MDASGGLPDGSGVRWSRRTWSRHCCKRPELFVSTLAEKLLTYALGRGVDHQDAPAVRRIVRRRAGRRLSVFGVGTGDREQPTLSNEDCGMIVSKKGSATAYPAQGRGSCDRAAAAGCDGAGHDGGGRHTGQPGTFASTGLRLYADGMRHLALGTTG